MFHLTTLERSYKKSDTHYNSIDMDSERFSAFLEAVTITKEEESDEDGNVIDCQTGFVFNSGLRHTACRVIRIEDGDKTTYLYHENPAIRVMTPELRNMIDNHREKEAA